MSRLILTAGFAGVLAFAAPALAQETPQPENMPPAAEAPAPAPSTSEMAAPTASAPATSSTAAPAASSAGAVPARAATPREVGSLVASEFATRDANHDGTLSRGEFTSWLRELVSRAPAGAAGDAAGLDARIGTAFTRSDSDGSGSISQVEMTSLLSRRH